MTRLTDTPVVVDTGVFGARLTSAGHELAFPYRPPLAGRPAVLSYASVAELRFGATVPGWGARRMRRLDNELVQLQAVWPGPRLTAKYVELRVWRVRNGHGLAHKDHEADRWIAATATWLDVPLVAYDTIFKNVDRLELLTRL
jgi:predicted nucleic acid-binding protein